MVMESLLLDNIDQPSDLKNLNKEQVTQDIKTWCSGILHREKSRNAGG